MRQGLLAALAALAVACGAREPAPVTPAPVAGPTAPPTATATGPRPTATPAPACPTAEAAARVLSCPAASREVTLVQVLEADRVRSSRATTAKKGGDVRERLAPRPPTKEDAAYLELAHAFVCSPHGKADAPHVAEVRYGLARTYFELQRWDEAAALFDAIARQEGNDVAPYAAQLALEAANVLHAHLDRAECLPTLARWVADYQARMCGDRPVDDREYCATLAKIRAEIDTRGR